MYSVVLIHSNALHVNPDIQDQADYCAQHLLVIQLVKLTNYQLAIHHVQCVQWLLDI